MLHPDFGGDAKRILKALGRSLAIIEFEPNGKIITANENFCRLLGYELPEIEGKHHSMFVDPDYVRSSDYKEFWAKLGRGEFDAREYKRFGKGGKEVWIQASYNPVVSKPGTVLKVVKVATDITAAKLLAAENACKLDAISRAQPVIEYSADGKILTANENFTKMFGYALEKIQGQQHRIFVDAAYAQSAEYQEFWRKLNRGECINEEYKRVGAGGKEIWIQASYNPIFDLDNRVVKVVNYMTDVTSRDTAVNQIASGLSRLAEGDLEQRIEVEFIPVARSASRRLQRVAGDAGTARCRRSAPTTQAIRTGTGEISTAADDLSRRTEQQASSLEETAAALEADHGDGEEDRRGRQARARRGLDRQGRRRQERRSGARGDGGDDRHRQVVETDQPDHRRHRRNRVPDQSSRVERRGRGGARRRRRPRLRRGRLRGARARPAFGAKRPRRSRA